MRKISLLWFWIVLSFTSIAAHAQVVDIDISQLHSMHLKNVTSGSLLDTTLNEYYNSINIIQSSSNKPEMCLELKRLGIQYNKSGNFTKAINCFLFALSIAESLNDTCQIISINNQLAYSLNILYRFKEAHTYSKKAETLLKQYPDTIEFIKLKLNLGHYYEKHGDIESAFNEYFKANKLNAIILDMEVQAHIYECIGSVYEDLDNLREAGKYFIKAIKIANKRNDKNYFQIASITNNVGDYYRKTGNLDSALIVYSKALKIAERNNLKDEVSANLLDLSKTYSALGEYAKANGYLLKHIDLNQYLYSSQIEHQIEMLDVLHNIEKKDREIDLQKAKIKSQKLTRTLLISMLLFSLLLAIILLIGYRKQSRMNAQLTTQNKKILQQSDDILLKSENLKRINYQLEESKKEIQVKSEKLSEANERYKHINSEKDKLFDIIAHDLKSPMQGILGFSSVLLDNYSNLDKENIFQYIKLIDSSSKRVNILIENLLSWFRSRNNRLEPVKELFDIGELTKENIKLFELNAIQKDIRIVSKVTPKTKVFADVDMVTLVLRNLISNAIKFSNEGGKVIIQASVYMQDVTIDVVDNGVGIKPEDICKLFNKGNLYKTFGTAGEKGTGLGLLICKEYIEKNNGYINVSSTLGQGTKFSFTLPGIAN